MHLVYIRINDTFYLIHEDCRLKENLIKSWVVDMVYNIPPGEPDEAIEKHPCYRQDRGVDGLRRL